MVHFFNEDIDELIVKPMELIMEHVIQIAKNPEKANSEEIVVT